MSIFLWGLQGVLAAVVGMSGLGKLAQPKDKLAETYTWMQDVSKGTVWFIGLVEVVGAIGLIAPAATGIAPVLTPIAAAGLAIFSLLAAILHIRRKELRGVAIVAILFVVAAVIAWGRFGPYGW
ncbi:DoxX family protein [Nocardia sp. CA-119907]|uniref:DoxX family protein n=1 Tax=Nocardia sp. CA-119907 TaxID=3239973 RepID=UPI003D95B454